MPDAQSQAMLWNAPAAGLSVDGCGTRVTLDCPRDAVEGEAGSEREGEGEGEGERERE